MYQSKIRILIDYFGLSFKYLSGEREGKDTIRDAIVAFKTMVSFSKLPTREITPQATTKISFVALVKFTPI